MESKKNKISFIIFIIFLVIIGIGGYLLMQFSISNKNGQTSFFSVPTKEPDKRIDSTKDYVYYDNENVILEDLEIGYKDIHINLKSGIEISNNLNTDVAALKNSIKYTKDVNIPENTEYEENEQGIYSLSYRDYIEYDYEDYISIMVMDSNYNVIDGTIPGSIKSYVFNKKADKLITESELLLMYKTTMETIKEKIKVKLNAEQETVDESPLIDIGSTLNNFKYGLAINKIGKLEINYIVSSTKQSYYDKIVIE